MARSNFFSRLTEKIGEVLPRRREEEDATFAPAAEKERKLYENADITMSLEDFLKENGRFGLKVYMISLIEFKEVLGDEWQRLLPKADMIAQSIMHRKLRSAGWYSPVDAGIYAAVMPKLDDWEAYRRADSIARELGMRLVGSSRFGAGFEPKARMAAIDAESLLKEDGTIDLSVIEQAVEEVRAADEDTQIALNQPAFLRAGKGDAPPLPPDWTFKALPEDRDNTQIFLSIAQTIATMTEQEQRSWLTSRGLEPSQVETFLRRHMTPSAPGTEQREGAELRRSMMATAARTSDEDGESDERGLRRHLMPSAAEAEPAPSAARPQPSEEEGEEVKKEPPFDVLFRPTWVAAGEAISGFVCFGRRRPSAAAEGWGAAELLLLRDRLVANAAVAALRSGDGAKYSLVVPLSANSLALRQGGAVDVISAIPEALRLLRLVIEVELGIGMDPSSLNVAMAMGRKLGRDVILRLPKADPKLVGLARSGDASFISLEAGESWPEMSAVLDAAMAAGLGACAWHVRKRDILAQAIMAGYAMVNGPTLMKDLAQPVAKILPAPKDRFAQAAG